MNPSTNTEQLRELLAKATPGPWKIQDGCSWRRIGTDRGDGNVLCPTNHSGDGHPDLTANGGDTYANLKLIVAAVNALPALLSELEQLRSELERRDRNEVRNCLNWGPCSRHDGRMAEGPPSAPNHSTDKVEGKTCRVCEQPILTGELCAPCAVGNDPFQQSKYSDGARP